MPQVQSNGSENTFVVVLGSKEAAKPETTDNLICNTALLGSEEAVRLILASSREVDFLKNKGQDEPGKRVLLPLGRKGISFLEGEKVPKR